MSSSSQNPDTFDQIMCGVPATSAWEALFTEAEEMLQEERPEGYDVLDIGHAAWDCLDDLPASEKAAALDVLFYTYWAARQDDLAARARYETGGRS